MNNKQQPHKSTSQSAVLLKAVGLHQAGKLDEAEALYKQLLADSPHQVESLTLLGTIYSQRGQYEEGITLLDKAITLNPSHAEAHFNRALSMQMQGKYEEALKGYEKATLADPNYDEAFWHKSLILLTLGQYEEGWKLYEWRWKRGRIDANRTFDKPLWLGQSISKAVTILVHVEQGYGDTLQFCRYLPMLAKQHKVIFECYKTLVPLMQYNYPDIKVVETASDYPGTVGLPPHNYHMPLLSLPHAFATTLHTIPSSPYLKAQPECIEKWQPVLDAALPPETFRAGLCWAGGQRPDRVDLLNVDARRSLHFEQIKPLLDSRNISFVSLQMGPPASQGDDARVQDFSSRIESWSDTAAIISQLDLVISADTAVCHLSAAMGKTTYLLNRYDTCWRWLIDRDDSPWYPSLIQFRQPRSGDWNSVIAKAKAAMIRQAAR